MRKIIVTLLFGLLALTGSALANAECGSEVACQLIDPMTGLWTVAINFNMLTGKVLHIEGDVYDVGGCAPPGQHLMGDLDLPAGPVVVYVQYQTPPPPGATVSATWQLGSCDPTDCFDYTLDGSDPAPCPMGADTTYVPLYVE